MDMKLELILLPAKDLAKSKDFYAKQLGFHVDHDVQPGNGMHIIQMTPPGSACSIAIGTGIGTENAAPLQGIHLVVADIEKMRDQLLAKDVDVSRVEDMGGVKFAYFQDPAGNSWALQQLNR